MTSRTDIRQQFLKAWQKQKARQSMTALEQSIARVIAHHPEYVPTVEHIAQNPDAEFFAALGEANPFMHMGLHLSLAEQITTDRPQGIRNIYADLLQKHAVHDAEHLMIEVLAKTLWEAERAGKLPDQAEYLNALKKLG